MDIDMVFREYLEIFCEYFVMVILLVDNKFVVLNSVVWFGGSFIYVFKGVKCEVFL